MPEHAISPSSRTRPALTADLAAGLVVFLVALPLCLGIALASNAPLFSGIVAGVVGGLVVGLISQSHTSVSGPAAGLTAVVAAQLVAVGSFPAFLLAVTIAGALQIVLGLARAGSIADFVPSSVIKGLLASIGLILILKQIPHLFGYDADPTGDMAFQQPDHENTFSELLNVWAGTQIQPGAAVVGLLSVALLLLWGRVKALKTSPVPGPLVVVVLGVVANLLFERFVSGWVIEPSHLVQVPVADSFRGFVGFFASPDFSAVTNATVYRAAVTIALVASLETLLNLEAVDKLDPQRRTSPPNRELVAQGVGNMLAGLLGGLPITSVIVRSSVNINAGAQTKRSAIVHGALLLLCVALLPAWLNRIPLAALAAVLITTGFKLASPSLFRQMWQAGSTQFLPFAITISAILLTDLLVGVLIGLAFGIFFVLRSNLRRPLVRRLENHIGGQVLHIELADQVSFLNRVALRNALEEAPRGGHVLLDARETNYIDADVLSVIHEFEHEVAPVHGVRVSLVGFKPHYEQLPDRVQYVDFATREMREQLTPAQVLQLLRDGNQRFRTGQALTRDLARLREQIDERHPLAVVLSGTSSRVPVERLFDTGLGEIVCARVTANMVGREVLGSLEYACGIGGAKVAVVLGHSDNKAVRLAIEALASPAAAGPPEYAHVRAILQDVQHAVDPAWLTGWGTASEEQRRAQVDTASRTHVRHTIDRILDESSALRAHRDAGRIALVGAMYDIRSGAVEFLD